MISILVGVGPLFGTGHVERMERLSELLVARNHRVMLTRIESAEQANALPDAKVVILDARDLDPRSFVCPSVIALDNQHSCRMENPPRVQFHDTIPHPLVSYNVAMENCLVESRACDCMPEKNALVYLGSTRMTFPFADEVVSLGYSLTQVGGQRSSGAITWVSRMAQSDFRKAICRASVVFTYFGMTALQVLYLGRRLVLFSIQSKVHDELSRYMR